VLDRENALLNLASVPSVLSYEMVPQVFLTLDAEIEMRGTVGLRDRAKRAVLGVLEAALEVRKLGTGHVHKEAPLILRMGSHLLTYSLDLDHESATIWGAEPVSEVATS